MSRCKHCSKGFQVPGPSLSHWEQGRVRVRVWVRVRVKVRVRVMTGERGRVACLSLPEVRNV